MKKGIRVLSIYTQLLSNHLSFTFTHTILSYLLSKIQYLWFIFMTKFPYVGFFRFLCGILVIKTKVLLELWFMMNLLCIKMPEINLRGIS